MIPVKTLTKSNQNIINWNANDEIEHFYTLVTETETHQ